MLYSCLLDSIVSMTTPFRNLELIILLNLKDSPEIGKKKIGLSAGEVHSNFPGDNSYTKEQVEHTIAVLALEGLVSTDQYGRLLDITREGLIALRTVSQ